MKTATRTAEATTIRGGKFELSASSTRGYEMKDEISYSDGWNVPIKTANVIDKDNIVLDIVGVGKFNGYFTDRKPSPTTPYFFGYFVSDRDNKVIPMDQEVYETLNGAVVSAKIEAETDQSWIEYQDRKAAAEKEEIEYYKHVKAVDNMMTLNGHTY